MKLLHKLFGWHDWRAMVRASGPNDDTWPLGHWIVACHICGQVKSRG